MQALKNEEAKVNDPMTWCDFETAVDAVRLGRYDYIGFVFNNNEIVGVDLDGGCHDENGFFSERTVDIVINCRSYMERSKSGNGIHIFVKGVLPFNGKTNKTGVEIYQAGRYFIMTGQNLFFSSIVENQDGIDYIISKYFNDVSSNEVSIGSKIYNVERELPSSSKIHIAPEYPIIERGSRNICLTSLAGQLKNLGYPKEVILKEVIKCNRVAAKPPLPTHELHAIVNSVMKYKN
jgi:hypothetical protein